MSAVAVSALAGLGVGLLVMVAGEILRRRAEVNRDRAKQRAEDEQRAENAVTTRLERLEQLVAMTREDVAGLTGIMRYFHPELREPSNKERAIRVGNGDG